MTDEYTRHVRRIRRLRRSAQRWSVMAGGLSGAAIVLTPYHGLGVPDAFWMAAAGSSVALAFWRWVDWRVLALAPPPPRPDPAVAGERARKRIEGFVASFPGGREALGELRRQRARAKLRGSSVASAWRRLDQASATLGALSSRLGGPAEDALLEATVAERGLRELAERAASVERASGFAGGDARAALDEAHGALVAQFEEGVAAYEGLVGAAAAYVAEDGRAAMDNRSVSRLNDAAELLRAVAAGFAELRADVRVRQVADGL